MTAIETSQDSILAKGLITFNIIVKIVDGAFEIFVKLLKGLSLHMYLYICFLFKDVIYSCIWYNSYVDEVI